MALFAFRFAALFHELAVLLALGDGAGSFMAERDAALRDGSIDITRTIRRSPSGCSAPPSSEFGMRPVRPGSSWTNTPGRAGCDRPSLRRPCRRRTSARRSPRDRSWPTSRSESERRLRLGSTSRTQPLTVEPICTVVSPGFTPNGSCERLHQAVEARLHFDEVAEVGGADDASGELSAGRIAIGDVGPGIGLVIFHRQRDALAVVVDLDDLDVHFLSHRHDLFRIGDAAGVTSRRRAGGRRLRRGRRTRRTA